jgi:hypothetical protein
MLLYSRAAIAQDPASQTTPAPDKSQYTLFNPTPIDLRLPYNTDRPSKTDSPYTIDAGVSKSKAMWRTGRSITKEAYALALGSLATRTSSNDGGKLAIGFLSSIKIPTNTGGTGNHVWEPGFGLPVNYSLP